MFENLAMTKTLTEKLHGEFSRKYLLLTGELGSKNIPITWHDWRDYLRGLNGVEYIYKFSNLAEQIDYLLEVINEQDSKSLVVRCPACKENFIMLTKDAAERTLALGLP